MLPIDAATDLSKEHNLPAITSHYSVKSIKIKVVYRLLSNQSAAVLAVFVAVDNVNGDEV